MGDESHFTEREDRHHESVIERVHGVELGVSNLRGDVRTLSTRMTHIESDNKHLHEHMINTERRLEQIFHTLGGIESWFKGHEKNEEQFQEVEKKAHRILGWIVSGGFAGLGILIAVLELLRR